MLSKRIFVSVKSGKWSNQGYGNFYIPEILNDCLLSRNWCRFQLLENKG